MKVIRANSIKIESSEVLQGKTSVGSAHEAIKNLINIKDEHIQHVKAERDGHVVMCEMHPFVEAVHMAYSYHLPLVISPDMIWYLISSGLAHHINKHSEELRDKFVNHQGKKEINIRRDDFVLNSQSNPWHEVIDEFSIKIGELTKNEIADTLMANFSTTTKDSRVVSQIVLMDAMQKYFDYKFTTMCGVPEIRLSGSKDDWLNVKGKTKKIVSLVPDFQKWLDNGLEEILDHFVNAFDDNIDKDFWNSIYKVDGGSGGPFLSGWLLALFPYLHEGEANRYVWESNWKESSKGGWGSGLTTSSFDYHMSQVPFVWDYHGDEIKMLFVGGLIGVLVEKDSALLPVFGYGITENKVKTNPNKDL